MPASTFFPRLLLVLAVVAFPGSGVVCQASVGAAVGIVFDAPEARVALGVDARVALPSKHWVLNPRVSMFLAHDGKSATQFDANLLYRFAVLDSSKLEPFVGVGGAVISGDLASPGTTTPDNWFGINFVSGVTFRTRRAVEPFAHVVYTVARERLNTFTALTGLSWTPGR